MDYADTTGASYEAALDYAKPYSFTRAETYEEGLARYYVIASAARAVSLKMNRPYCKSLCNKIKEKKEAFSCHKTCLRTTNWRWSRKELEYLTLTVLKLESGYRADVHGGVPPKGRGDCAWKNQKTGKRTAAWAKGALPIMSTCKSVCLGQINLGQRGKVKYKNQYWYSDDLVGIDYTSTEQCLTAVGKYLSRSRLWCTSHLAPRTNDWAGATMSMYGTGRVCDSKKLLKRSGVFWKTYNHPIALQPKAKKTFQDPQVMALIQQLMTTQSKVLWMIPMPQPKPAPTNQPSVVPPELQAQINESTTQFVNSLSPWTYIRPASL